MVPLSMARELDVGPRQEVSGHITRVGVMRGSLLFGGPTRMSRIIRQHIDEVVCSDDQSGAPGGVEVGKVVWIGLVVTIAAFDDDELMTVRQWVAESTPLYADTSQPLINTSMTSPSVDPVRIHRPD